MSILIYCKIVYVIKIGYLVIFVVQWVQFRFINLQVSSLNIVGIFIFMNIFKICFLFKIEYDFYYFEVKCMIEFYIWKGC